MPQRKAHGNAAKGGSQIVWESTPTDELRPLAAPATARAPRRSDGRFTSESAAEAVRRRHELAKLPDFAEFEFRIVAAEDWQPFETLRRANYDRVVREIEELTGACSRRVRAVLRGWAFLAAAAEYHAAVFASTCDSKSDDRAERRFRAASIELAKAWDFARLDAESRPKDPRAAHDFTKLVEGGSNG